MSGTAHPNPHANVELPGHHRLRTEMSGTGHPNLHANVVKAAGGWQR
jgi:hypothetical protein